MSAYIGRFAPSPSGPLHLGSLTCALASYLDAKKNFGQWLVRIEDIDPAREQSGATNEILDSLVTHGLVTESEIIYQSARSHAYTHRLQTLIKKEIAYSCDCTRARLTALEGMYDGKCSENINKPLSNAYALRLDVKKALKHKAVSESAQFTDMLKGDIHQNLLAAGDFVIHRKENLFAYQLAVVSDDIDQNVSHVVRGSDLLAMTAQQQLLFGLFDAASPKYAHIPVIIDENGRKLSKQNHAQALTKEHATQNLVLACRALGLNPPLTLQKSECPEIISWALPYWPNLDHSQRESITLAEIL